MQKAADAAALAGAVFMPENTNGIAFTTAKDIAAKNGYQDGADGVTVDVEPGQHPNQLKVTINETVKNSFAVRRSAIGSTDLGRHAVGEYQRPVSMGSPINQFGNDPRSRRRRATARPATPTSGRTSSARRRRRRRATRSSRRSAAAPTTAASSNTDYDPNGYFYAIDVHELGVTARGPGVRPGVRARRRQLRRQRQQLEPRRRADLPANFNPAFPARVPPSVRYSPAATSPYCTGDMIYTEGNNVVPWTVYRVRAPDLTPARRPTTRCICSVEFPGLPRRPRRGVDRDDAAGRRAGAVRRVLPPVVHALHGQQPARSAPTSSRSRRTRRSTARPHRPAAARTASRCGRRSAADRSSVQIHGEGRIGIYANSPAANTTFYLARVLPGAHRAARWSSASSTSATPRSPVRSPCCRRPTRTSASSFTGCTYTPPPGNSTGPPWGTFTPTGDRLHDHERQQRHLQRPVDPAADPDPEQLLVRLQRPVRLLAPGELRLPGPRSATPRPGPRS